MTGNFSSSGAREALSLLLQQQRVGFQALVCANDEMAHGAITLLSQQGFRVPEDVAVVGFDDSEEFRHVVPALTTVQQPFFEQGVRAAEALLDLIEYREVPLVLPVPTRLVVRESCGSKAPSTPMDGAPVQGHPAPHTDPASGEEGVLENLQTLLQEALYSNTPACFLAHWRTLLLERTLLDEEFSHWQGVLLETFRHAEHTLPPSLWPRLSVLKDQAQVMLTGALQMVHSTRRIHNMTRAMHLPVLFSASSTTELYTQIKHHLQHLSLRTHVLVLRDPAEPEQARVVLADGGEDPDTRPFPVSQVLPQAMQQVLQGGHTLITPLFDPERMLGHLVYRPPSDLFFDEESLCYTLSRAVQHHLQQQTLQQHADELERQVEERTRELQALNQELQRSAFLDGLTGIHNRTAFKDHLGRVWAQHLRKKQPLGLVLCDVDFFKKYNDYYGHLQGDRCLREVASVLEGSVRQGDFVARFGGEEFVLVLPETTHEGAVMVARRVQQELQLLGIPHLAPGAGERVTLSMGAISTVPAEGDTPEDLLERADRLLYQAKARGRACVVSSLEAHT